MRTIHVWPRYIKEFLLTHLGCNSPNSMDTCKQKNEPQVPANFVDAARLLAAAVERLIYRGIEPWKISR